VTRGAVPAAITIVAAVADGGVIGAQGRLPWRLPADLARFRRITMGHPVIAGRKTFQSIGRALEGRRMIVLTRDASFRAPGVTVAHSAREALRAAGAGECFVIGGAAVYRQFLPLATRMHITRIHAAVAGDAFFPPVDGSEWRLAGSAPGTVDADNPLPHVFETWERRAP
jgi:dihydrofolate reductase